MRRQPAICNLTDEFSREFCRRAMALFVALPLINIRYNRKTCAESRGHTLRGFVLMNGKKRTRSSFGVLQLTANDCLFDIGTQCVTADKNAGA